MLAVPPRWPDINCETRAAATVPTGLASVGAPRLERRLYDEYRVELPVLVWRDRPCLRLPASGPARRASLGACASRCGTTGLDTFAFAGGVHSWVAGRRGGVSDARRLLKSGGGGT